MGLRKFFLFFCFCLIQGIAFAAIGVHFSDTQEGYAHWSAGKHYNEDENTVRDALPALARQAYEEMREDAADKGYEEAVIPVTMSALAIGSDVYFSSNMRKRQGGLGPFLVDPGNADDYVNQGVAEQVLYAIRRCQQAHRGAEHRYDMRCAEPLAAHMFLVNNPEKSIVGVGKISTYGIVNDQGDLGILNPCDLDDDGRWGCAVFVGVLNLERVGNNYDKPPDSPIQPADGYIPHCLWSGGEGA